MKSTSLNGKVLDARIKQAILDDFTLRADLTGDEFRAFILLTVWAVSLVDEGRFRADHAIMTNYATADHLDKFEALGLIERDGPLFRIVDHYWGWQSTKKELEALARRREEARGRQATKRERERQSLRAVE